VLANLLAANRRRLRLALLRSSSQDGRYAWLIRPCLKGWYRLKGMQA
jgi:hypothetical protein